MRDEMRAVPRDSDPAGLAAALGAFFIWGFMPLLFTPLAAAGPLLVVAWRTVLALILVGVGLMVIGRLREVRQALASRRTVAMMALSSLLLAFNWGLYIYSVISGQTLESAFGYFINPMMNVAIGMVLLGERQNRWQSIAIGIALVALLIQASGLGGVPYIALGLALSFALYGYARKTTQVASTPGLFVETLLLSPLAVLFIFGSFLVQGAAPYADPLTVAMLLLTGPATALPLLMFAFAMQRLRMTTMGMLQYLGPTIQFLLAIFVLGESLNGLRLLSFALIWVSLAVYTAGSIRRVPVPEEGR